MNKLVDLIGSSKFLIGLFIGSILFGCAGVTFPYKYYDPEFVSYQGTLLGPTEADDIDGSVCAPSPSSKHPCVIMKASDFFAMKLEFQDMQNRLNYCQSPSPAP